MKTIRARRGVFLIAHPELLDPNFRRTVVLMCEHGPEGSMGLVLNRLGDKTAAGMLTEIEDLPECAHAVMSGGPVGKDQIYVLYRRAGIPSEDAAGIRSVGPSLQLVGNIQDLQDMAALDAAAARNFRLFVGYSGWGPGQLDHELALGSWYVTPARPEFVFDMPSDEVWSRVLKSMGGEYALIAAMPDDLSVN